MDSRAQHFFECDLCETRPAQHFCKKCTGSLCHACKQEHERKKLFQNHEIISLALYVQERKIEFGICQVHNGRENELYCKSCLESICTDCITEQHKGHEIEKVTTVIEERKKCFLESISLIEKELIPMHEKLLFKTRAQASNIHTTSLETQSTMRNQAQAIIDVVKSVENHYNAITEESAKNAILELQSQEHLLEKRVNHLERIKEKLQSLCASLSAYDILFQNPAEELSNVSFLPEYYEYAHSRFTVGDIDRMSIENLFGKLHLSTKLKLSIKQSNQPTVHRKENPCRLVMKKPFRKANFGTGLAEQNYISCLSTKTCLIVSDDNFIRVIDIFGKIQGQIQTNVVTGDIPRGIAQTSINELIYADKKNKKVVFTKHWKASNVINTEWFPLAPCVKTSGNILIGLVFYDEVDEEKQIGKIVEYDCSGKVVRQIETYAGKRLFKWPICVNENAVNGNIIVSDTAMDRVIGVTNNGVLKFEYDGGVSKQPSASFWPQGLTCDKLGQILIVDDYSHSIHLLSDKGDIISILLTKTDLMKPADICFDGVDSLWIAEHESKRVKVFKYLHE